MNNTNLYHIIKRKHITFDAAVNENVRNTRSNANENSL